MTADRAKSIFVIVAAVLIIGGHLALFAGVLVSLYSGNWSAATFFVAMMILDTLIDIRKNTKPTLTNILTRAKLG